MRGKIRKLLVQTPHQPAKSMFAVCRANRPIETERFLLHAFELAIMREGHRATPNLARKGMRIFKRDATAIGAAHMGNDNLALQRIVAQQARNFGMGRGLRIVEHARAAPFIEGNAPAIAMRPRRAAPTGERCKGKANVCGDIRIHAEKFTHAAPIDLPLRQHNGRKE